MSLDFNDFFFLFIFLSIVAGVLYFIIEIFRGNVKWRDAEDTDAFMPPKSVFDSHNAFEHYDHQRRMSDAVNISHGHSPGVPYIRS